MTYIEVNRETTTHEEQVCLRAQLISIIELSNVETTSARNGSCLTLTIRGQKTWLQTERSDPSLNLHSKEVYDYKGPIKLQNRQLVGRVGGTSHELPYGGCRLDG